MTNPTIAAMTGGFALRECPVCKRDVRSHREPVPDERDEVVVYHPHDDSARTRCKMSGQVAALRAVPFTARRVA